MCTVKNQVLRWAFDQRLSQLHQLTSNYDNVFSKERELLRYRESETSRRRAAPSCSDTRDYDIHITLYNVKISRVKERKERKERDRRAAIYIEMSASSESLSSNAIYTIALTINHVFVARARTIETIINVIARVYRNNYSNALTI